MKECPNCRNRYSDDLFFCLDDGTQLRKIGDYVDPHAPTEAAVDVSSSLSTVVIPNPVSRPQGVPEPHVPQPKSHSKLLYLVIAVLTLACIGLVAVIVAINIDGIFSRRETPANAGRDSKLASSPTPAVAAASSPVSTPKMTSPAAPPATTFNPTGRWNGEWSTASGTLFDFELTLTEKGSNNLEGQIRWTMRRTARPDKADKVGFSAIEFVRGSYDATTGAVSLTGVRKDDPNNMLVMLDVYRLKVSSDGRNLTGAARNGGKWNGRVHLSR